jgi:N-acetylneuraminic acid mutarotase
MRMSIWGRIVASAFLLLAMTACVQQTGGPDEPGQPGVWTEGSPAPRARFEAQGIAVNDQLFVFGGFHNSQIEATAVSHRYDPGSGSWQPLEDMPEKLTHAGQVFYEATNTIYIVGGFVGDHPGPGTEQVWRYHIPSDTWSAGPSLPAPRGAGAAAVLGGKLHFFGGTEREGGEYSGDAGEHWILDLENGTTWQPAAPLPNPRNHLGATAVNGKVYAIGGQHLDDEEEGNQRDVHAYDPATDTWTAVSPLPRPLGHVAASTLVRDGRIVVIGGVTQNRRKVANVLEYDPATDTWRELEPLPQPRQSPVAGVIAGEIIVTTGADNDSEPRTTTWHGHP